MSPKRRSTLWAVSYGHMSSIIKNKKQWLQFSLHTTLILLIRHLRLWEGMWLIPGHTQFYCDRKACHQHCHSSSSELCMLAKSLQSWPTLCDPMDCSLLASSVRGILPGKNTGVDCHALLQRIFPTQGLNLCLLCLLHWHLGSLPLAPPGKLLELYLTPILRLNQWCSFHHPTWIPLYIKTLLNSPPPSDKFSLLRSLLEL